MRFKDVGTQTCSVARTLSVIGDRWTMMVLREAFLRTRRFDEFQARIGAARHIVADRLKKLVEHGILERRKYQDRPARYEYRLTDKGLDLHPILLSMAAWGDRWMDQGEGPPVEYVHKDCGQVMRPVLDCSVCGKPVEPRNVQPQAGPALRKLAEADPSAPSRFKTR
jgi:DNA-binding HxlR family transcriptional regulator